MTSAASAAMTSAATTMSSTAAHMSRTANTMTSAALAAGDKASLPEVRIALCPGAVRAAGYNEAGA
jgi:hypothetical protein